MSGHVGFVVDAGGRGTLDIVWSCMITIVFCTWTIQRLNIVHTTSFHASLFRRKVNWMLTTLLCPEYVAWLALEQWRSVQHYTELHQLGFSAWTIKQAFYVDMGGLLLRCPLPSSTSADSEKHDHEQASAIDMSSGEFHVIRMADLITLVRADVLDPSVIRKEDLEESSKANGFARFVTYFQVLYFLTVTFGRLCSHYSISALEVTTVAFVFCAAMTEFLWWNKPLDLRSSTVVTLSGAKVEAFHDVFEKLRFPASEQDRAERITLKESQQWWHKVLDSKELKRKLTSLVCIGCLYNAIIVSAWHLDLPSAPELLLWHLSSLVACASMLGIYLAGFLRNRSLAVVLCACVGTTSYVVARAYLMIEMLISFRSMSPELYETPAWQNVLP